MDNNTITIKLDKQDSSILVLFCNRSFLERIEPFAEDKSEAQKMLEAITRLGLNLEKQGFSVR